MSLPVRRVAARLGVGIAALAVCAAAASCSPGSPTTGRVHHGVPQHAASIGGLSNDRRTVVGAQSSIE